jgi:diguanylate cyclase (GGDEF)-like protein/putative nucleotidyltransferase with HDIG domain
MTTPEFATIVGAGAIVLILLLLAAALAIVRARCARTEMQRKTRDLVSRAEKLRLLNRLSSVLPHETRRRDVARAAAEFFVREMGAGRAVIWQPDSEGEPQAPWISFPRNGRSGAPALLPEAQRIILARTAARGNAPLVVLSESPDQRPQPLRMATAPARGFTLYVPLGCSPREALLEIYSGRQSWRAEQWELLAPLAAEFADALRRARHYEEIRERADIDFVTGLFNHRFVHVFMQRLISAEGARERGFAVLLMDVDNFKTFNDTYGHSVGDRILQVIADQLKLMTDQVGIVGRFGGDEFIVVLPGNSREEADAFGHAFQDWLTSYRFKTPSGQTVRIVVSAGLAVFPEDADRRQELLAVADARLYQSKRSGSRMGGLARRRPDGDTGLGVFGLLGNLVSSVDKKDHYTRAHCETTAEYAVMLAQEIGLSPSAQRTLRLAALLHDVGKICIPDAILRKTGQLTPEEFAVIKHHVSIAENLIVDVPNAKEVREIARHHHERYDGSGYPDGLQGEEIPYLARILALADAFSAMSLDRPFRLSLPRDDAYAELQRVAGTQLDPDLVRDFGRVMAGLKEEQAVSATSA